MALAMSGVTVLLRPRGVDVMVDVAGCATISVSLTGFMVDADMAGTRVKKNFEREVGTAPAWDLE